MEELIFVIFQFFPVELTVFVDYLKINLECLGGLPCFGNIGVSSSKQVVTFLFG